MYWNPESNKFKYIQYIAFVLYILPLFASEGLAQGQQLPEARLEPLLSTLEIELSNQSATSQY